MHIIAIGWLFVALMLSLGQQTVIGGVLAFIAWGPLPLALTLYLLNGPARRRSMRMRDDSMREQDAAQPRRDP